MGRASRAIEGLNEQLDRAMSRLVALKSEAPGVADTLEDVLLRERQLFGDESSGGVVKRMGGDSGLIVSPSDYARTSSHSSGGVGRQRGSGGAGSRDGYNEDVAAWQAYVRESNRMGLYGNRVLDFNEWRSAGKPTAFEFGGYIDTSGGPAGFGPDRGRFGAPTQGPRSPGFVGGARGPGFAPGVIIPGTGIGGGRSVAGSDTAQAVVAELAAIDAAATAARESLRFDRLQGFERPVVAGLDAIKQKADAAVASLQTLGDVPGEGGFSERIAGALQQGILRGEFSSRRDW